VEAQSAKVKNMRIPSVVRTIRRRLENRSLAVDRLVYELSQLRDTMEKMATIAKEQYVARSLNDVRYSDPLRLERYGFKVYSQYDEDGIIEEIFHRIGMGKKLFIEFGVETGIENNTLKLLLEGWRGLWIEGNSNYVTAIKTRFRDVIATQQLTVNNAFVTRENINELIRPWAVGEIDFLSIDIDGNDFHIWKALTIVRPRAVVIEYNAKFRPPISISPTYNPDHNWSGTDYMGSSLEALVRLGKRRGYCLVGCNFAGVNAFFVRSDLAKEKFHEPFSAENHYHPARYFLEQLYRSGHAPDWGTYMQVSESVDP
jgi:hypothetical protein